MLSDWSRNLTPLSYPIGCKTKTNCDLVTRVRSRRLHVFTLSSYWLLVTVTFVLIGRCDYFGFCCYDTQSKSALLHELGVKNYCKTCVYRSRAKRATINVLTEYGCAILVKYLCNLKYKNNYRLVSMKRCIISDLL